MSVSSGRGDRLIRIVRDWADIYTMSVFEFNDDDKVTALRVYMQQEQDEKNVLISGTESS